MSKNEYAARRSGVRRLVAAERLFSGIRDVAARRARATVAFTRRPNNGATAAAASRLPFSFRPTFSGCAVTLPDSSSEPLRLSVAVSLTGNGLDRSSLICRTFSASGAIASFTGRGVERLALKHISEPTRLRRVGGVGVGV